ncbi:hypothetical protein ACHHYP_08384 [Achlya hypogyna]|uniref:FYVE-type domain-containing protein n=1 Tax=Achlya hypogyna TaxID=1202772 RepID=A0A1V9ZKU9_ACHHY|nr:hypothetical protein ACHHYP_08384 [Achlya hypogyna]
MRGKQVFCLSFSGDGVASPDVAWMANDESALCVICTAPFHTWTKRRHHCRLCGRLVCNDCSKHRAYVGGESKRTCRLCGDVLHMLQALGDGRVHSKAGKPPALFFQQPNPRDEYATIMTIAQTAPATDDCYIIAASWLRRWVQYVTAQGDHPGAIANHTLLSFHCGQLVPKLDVPPTSYHAIHPEVWKVFRHFYGGGPSISVHGPSKAWNIHLRPTEVFGHCWFPMDDSDGESMVHVRESEILRHLVIDRPTVVVTSSVAARYTAHAKTQLASIAHRPRVRDNLVAPSPL